MDGNVDAGEIQHRRKNGAHGNGAVGLAGELGHQKGGGAHNGRHDLTAGGGGGFHRAGELALIAGLFHHGNGDGAGGDGVAHRGSGHHAAQGGGDHRHLGGTAGSGAGHGVGQADEEAGDARPLQKGAEDDEHHNELGADIDGTAEDSVGGVEHGTDHLVQGDLQLAHIEGAHQIKEGVDQQHARHTQNRQTHAPAAQLHQSQDADEADEHIQIVLHNPGGHVNHLLGIDGVKEIGARAGNQQQDIIPGHVVDPAVALLRRIYQKADHQNHSHEDGQTALGQNGEKHRVHDAVSGEERHQDANQQGGHSLPYPGIGLPVVLFHHRFHIGSGANGGIDLLLHDRFFQLRLLFLEQAHGAPPHFGNSLNTL